MMKYFWPIKSVTFFFGLIIVVAVFCVFAHYTYSQKSSCQIEFTLNTPSPIEFGIYYDIGHGLSQNDHQSKLIDAINQETSVSFCISSYRKLRTIRFDPAMQPIKMTISSITLRYDDGSIFEVPFQSLQPGGEILAHSWDDNGLIFETTPDSSDSSFSLTMLHDGKAKDDTISRVVYYGSWIVAGILLMLLGRFMVLFFFLGL